MERQEYPKVMYYKHPQYVIVQSAEEEKAYKHKGYTTSVWKAGEADHLIEQEEMPVVDTTLKGVVCPVCQKICAHKGALRFHMKKHKES